MIIYNYQLGDTFLRTALILKSRFRKEQEIDQDMQFPVGTLQLKEIGS